jgi:GntR family transcriptional regulator of arabinose operon
MAEHEFSTEALNASQPKNMAVAARMRAHLADGRWAPGDQIPTARQLAHMFGVSLSPVLQAVRMLEREGLLVRKARVGTFVAERIARKQLVAFITSTCDLEPNMLAIRGFEEEIARRNYGVMFCNANREPERFAERANACLELGAAGIAFVPPEGSLYLDWNRAFYQGFADRGIPVVAINSQPFPESGPSIVSAAVPDGVWQGRQMAKHLIGLGHTHLAFLYGRWSCTVEDRKQGVIAELQEHGLPALEVRSLSPEELLRTGEVYDVSVMLDDWLGRTPPITAVVCVSDYAARILYEHAVGLGLTIPGDISCSGFDDSSFASLLTPSLTTLRVPYADIGRSAAELLVSQIEDPTRPARLLMSRGELVVRASCRPVNGSG